MKAEVRVEAHSGNVKPWRARVYVDGKLVATSGYCRTESAARRAGERLAETVAR